MVANAKNELKKKGLGVNLKTQWQRILTILIVDIFTVCKELFEESRNESNKENAKLRQQMLQSTNKLKGRMGLI
jgi:hypothetical protein